ncbi:MAG: HEAT repeat domain-containing protein [Myxococcota bacterium]|nr:HEAT repeat domain-containing protein [Myxococcota bacterium]
MQTAAADPFQSLLAVVDRYRNDVHNLRAPATEEAVASARSNLTQPIPRSLMRFLHRWNGAVLFRGVLQIRSVNELASAAEHVPDVIVFADGPLETDHWAYAPDAHGDAVFGRWTGELFEPLHEDFQSWLAATIQILDNNIRDPEARFQTRLDADPNSGFLLLQLAERLLTNGKTDAAIERLRQATAAHPGMMGAWERLGVALLNSDQGQARWALLKAFRGARLPQSVPTVFQPSAALVTTLAGLFPKGDDAWERELIHFLTEAVTDVVSYEELSTVELAGVALAQVHLDRQDRTEAHSVLVDLLERARGFQLRGPMPEATLMLARIEVDLGHHDDAERRLRALRYDPRPTSDRARLLLGTIAASRQEPWCEAILLECLAHMTRPADRSEALLMLGERHLLREHYDEAKTAFSEAQTLAKAANLDSLEAQAVLGLGDVLRLTGEYGRAAETYQQARGLAGDNAELLQRVLIRRGDLFRLQGDAERAVQDYERAADEYGRLGLPIREAWARLRMAQTGTPGAAEDAHALFKSVDHAAGVAASDAIAGHPARSLDWHLNRSADHSRDRWNAQRARPPLTRADAERPERRIGAHRMAIAACTTEVVAVLRSEIDALSKTIDLNSPRSTDPNLARFVAATDLLSAHRSYEAAEALLNHLLVVKPGGIAKRALVGAMARSPNAALVDGLLDALEGSSDPQALGNAIEVLGLRREPLAIEPLKAMVGPGNNPTSRKAAIVSLGRIGDISSIDCLLPSLEEPELAEETSVALLLLGEWQGVDYQAQSLASHRPGMNRSLGEIVGRYGGPNYLLLLFRSAELEGPAGLGALQGLGYLGDPRAIPRLIEATASRDPARVRVASGALELITGHHEDPEESLLRNRWTNWWAEHESHFEDGFRYRHGRLMDPGLLIDRLSHDDPMVRRSTYDELVIATGQRLPFDAEGPYRVQTMHIANWRQWWMNNNEAFPAGRWTFHGEQIG